MPIKDPIKRKAYMEAYHSDYDRAYYIKYKKRKKELFTLRSKDMVSWYIDLKSKLSCTKCPENHWSCLEFHHENDDKRANVGDMIHGNYSKKSILEEMAKCIVICANCHRKLHAIEDGRC